MKRIGVFFKPDLIDVALLFKKRLEKENYEAIFYDSLTSENEIKKGLDLTIVLGGDGTFLKAAHIAESPLVGFKGGRLGFLSSYTLSDFNKFLKDLQERNFVEDKRTFLKVNNIDNFCLNEVLIIKDPTQKILDIKVAFQDGDLYFHADGIILSTPTGSTAYSLSLGGPILLPNVEAFVITPVAPQFLASRSVVIPDNENIIVELNQEANLILDGTSFGKISKIVVEKSQKSIVILRPKDYNFSKSIKEKLGFGKNFYGNR